MTGSRQKSSRTQGNSRADGSMRYRPSEGEVESGSGFRYQFLSSSGEPSFHRGLPYEPHRGGTLRATRKVRRVVLRGSPQPPAGAHTRPPAHGADGSTSPDEPASRATDRPELHPSYRCSPPHRDST